MWKALEFVSSRYIEKFRFKKSKEYDIDLRQQLIDTSVIVMNSLISRSKNVVAHIRDHQSFSRQTNFV